MTAAPLLRSGAAGLVVGLDLLGRAMALSLLVFSGGLAAGAGPAAVLFIAAGLAVTLSTLLVRGMPASLRAVMGAPDAVLMPVIFALDTGAASGGATAEVRIATAFALLGLTAMVTGLALLLMAMLDLGRIARTVPFPVTAGFLASSGALLIVSAAQFALPEPIARLPEQLASEPSQLATAGLAAALALLLAALTRWRPDVGPVLGLALAVSLFYAVMAAFGSGTEDARALGLLPSSPRQETGAALAPLFRQPADWSVVADAVPTILAASLIGLFGTVLSITGVELGIRADVPVRSALRDTGVVNLVAGALGGSVAHLSPAATLTANAIGGSLRTAGTTASVVLGLGLFLAGDLVSYVPRFVTAALMAYVGFALLWGWLLGQRRRQARADWLVAGAIVAATLVFGILVAIGVGLISASLIFAVTYARLPVIRRSGDLASRRSTVDRGPAQTQVLDRLAGRVVTVSVRGFLFFGSVEGLVEHVRQLLEHNPAVGVIILDLDAVSGVDATALAAFRKLEYLAQDRGAAIVLADVRPTVAAAFDREGIAAGEAGTLRRAPSTDGALEAAEADLLSGAAVAGAEDDARSALASLGCSRAVVDRLLAAMRRETVAAGERVIAFGDLSGDIFVIDSGRLAVRAQGPDGRTLRLRSLSAGAVVGEIASYLGTSRTADVVAEEETTMYRISPDTIEQWTKDDAHLAAAWHRMMARSLADKIHRTTLMLSDRT